MPLSLPQESARTQVHICESGRRADKNEGSGEGRKQGERRKERKEQDSRESRTVWKGVGDWEKEGGTGEGERKEMGKE